jgi:two-component system chemotaxis response regulator CheY
MSKVILVVDDSSMMRMTVGRALREAGYDVLEAEDGEKALEQLNNSGKVNLIISDVNMPKMDGITFVQNVKEIPQYKFIPIIMLTTESQQELIEKGKKAGVRAWMVKPFDKQQLLGAIEKLIMM